MSEDDTVLDFIQEAEQASDSVNLQHDEEVPMDMRYNSAPEEAGIKHLICPPYIQFILT